MTTGLANFMTIIGWQNLHTWLPFLNTSVTESQTASSFLQLLTNALHDQHQIYDFISQNKTIMAALVRNCFLNNNTNFKMFQYVATYRLTNDVGRTSKGKY